MKKINGVNNFSINSPTILTLGTFDGVHKGHQKILKKLKSEAKKDSLKSVVLTFFPHPRTCLLYTSPSPRDRTRSRMPSSA